MENRWNIDGTSMKIRWKIDLFSPFQVSRRLEPTGYRAKDLQSLPVFLRQQLHVAAQIDPFHLEKSLQNLSFLLILRFFARLTVEL